MEQSLYESVRATVQFVKGELQKRKGRWADIAEATELSKRIVEKFAEKELDPVAISTTGLVNLDKLAKYFREQQLN